MTRTVALLGLLVILGSDYWLLIRPTQLRWGAADTELKRAMPEDDLVADPAFDATRAITIRARPEQIWPWLAQTGYGRAGFYGYELIENAGSGAGLRSAERILPALQNPHPGDVLPLSLAATLDYGTVEPNQNMVWRGHETSPSAVFTWKLVPVDTEHTRLISRIRWRYLKSPMGVALGVFTLLVLIGWRWGTAWWFALAAGTLLQVELYASPPVSVTAATPFLLLGWMIWSFVADRHRSGREHASPNCIGARTESI